MNVLIKPLIALAKVCTVLFGVGMALGMTWPRRLDRWVSGLPGLSIPA